VARAADEASEEEKGKVGEYWAKYCGGPAIEAMLEDLWLVDAQYCIALAEEGGILPRYQAIPESAWLGPHNKWRLRCWRESFATPVLVLSYPWLDRTHPDRQGEQLRKILPILKVMVEKAKQYGAHGTIGVLWDYPCLPQRPYRNERDQERFKVGLRGLNAWYSHPYTHVLLMTTPLPDGADYGNRRPYGERGWCHVERRLSGLVKDEKMLWDMSAFTGTQTHYLGLRNELKAGREPFMSPDRVARELREGVASGAVAFTAASDVELVIDLYARGFVRAFDTFKEVRGGRGSLFYERLGWGRAEVPILVEAIEYANKHCKLPEGGLDLWMFDGNKFDDEDKAKLRAAAPADRFKVQ